MFVGYICKYVMVVWIGYLNCLILIIGDGFFVVGKVYCLMIIYFFEDDYFGDWIMLDGLY